MVLRSIKKILEEIDSETDDDVLKCVQKKYYHLMHLSTLFPNIKGKWFYISLFQWFFFIFMMGVHCVLFAISASVTFEINFVLFSESMHYFVMDSIAITIFLFVNRERRTFARYHKCIHSGFYDYQEGNEAIKKKHEDEMLMEWRRLLVLPVILCFAGNLIVFVAPILDQYGTFSVDQVQEHAHLFNTPIPMWYPIDTSNIYFKYLAYFGQLSCVYTAGIVIAAGGIGYISLTQYVIRELGVLLDSVDNMEERASNMYLKIYGRRPADFCYQDKNYVRCYLVCFKKVHEHHKVILKVSQDVGRIIGIPIFVAFSGAGLLIALASLTTTSGGVLPGKTFAALVQCVLEIAYMFFFSLYGQRVKDRSEEFRDRLYNMKWYNYYSSIKSNLSVMQSNTMNPIEFSMYGLAPANLSTFASIMNSAYSFYNLVVAAN